MNNQVLYYGLVYVHICKCPHTRLKSRTLGEHALLIEVYHYHEDGPSMFLLTKSNQTLF